VAEEQLTWRRLLGVWRAGGGGGDGTGWMGQLSATWTASDTTTATAAVPNRPPGAMSDRPTSVDRLAGDEMDQ
jgi:hypothetical protein